MLLPSANAEKTYKKTRLSRTTRPTLFARLQLLQTSKRFEIAGYDEIAGRTFQGQIFQCQIVGAMNEHVDERTRLDHHIVAVLGQTFDRQVALDPRYALVRILAGQYADSMSAAGRLHGVLQTVVELELKIRA